MCVVCVKSFGSIQLQVFTSVHLQSFLICLYFNRCFQPYVCISVHSKLFIGGTDTLLLRTAQASGCCIGCDRHWSASRSFYLFIFYSVACLYLYPDLNCCLWLYGMAYDSSIVITAPKLLSQSPTCNHKYKQLI